MAWRVTQEEVRSIIDDDSDISLSPFIDTANTLTDYVNSKDSQSLLNSSLLKEIERWLSAHFYAHLDQQFTDKKTGDATAKFQGEYEMALDGTKWGQVAKMLDVTGTLASLSRERHQVGLQWLGLPPSEQTDYINRD